jgi:hypothetical protein
MRKLHSIAALRGDGLRPELRAQLDRLTVGPNQELFMRPDGMVQSGPDPAPGPHLVHMRDEPWRRPISKVKLR